MSRVHKIEDLLRKELADIISRKMRDPRISMLGVSSVRLSRDLAHAKVYISIIKSDLDEEAVIQVLNEATPFIRTILAKQVRLRIVPQLYFLYDGSVEQGRYMNDLIAKAMSRNHDNEE